MITDQRKQDRQLSEAAVCVEQMPPLLKLGFIRACEGVRELHLERKIYSLRSFLSYIRRKLLAARLQAENLVMGSDREREFDIAGFTLRRHGGSSPGQQ